MRGRDPAEVFRAEHQRVMRSRERLQTRLQSAFRDVAKATDLFGRYPELGEPDISVRVFAQFVQMVSSLNGGQLDILPLDGRVPALERYAAQLAEGVARVAADVRLEVVQEPGGPLGHSQQILVGHVPSGYMAILRRPEPE